MAKKILLLGMTLFKNVIFERRLKTELSTANKAVIEVVFTPPPVPAGDAPIIINKMNINKALLLNSPIAKELKPTVV